VVCRRKVATSCATCFSTPDVRGCVQVWPYLLGYYSWGATRSDCEAQDEAARCQYETTVSEWLAVEAIVTQCDREAMEANIARLSAEQTAAAAAAAGSSAEAAVRAAAAMLEVVDEGVQADEPRSTTEDALQQTSCVRSRLLEEFLSYFVQKSYARYTPK